MRKANVGGDLTLRELREVRHSPQGLSSLAPPPRTVRWPQQNLGFPVPLLESGLRLDVACWALGYPLPHTPQGQTPRTQARPLSRVRNTVPHLHLWSVLEPQVCVSVRDDLVSSSVPWLSWPPCLGHLSCGGCRASQGDAGRAPHIVRGCLGLMAQEKLLVSQKGSPSPI